MNTRAIYPVIPVRDLEANLRFYAPLLGLKTSFANDWYVSLVNEAGTAQLAFVAAGHPSIPSSYRSAPSGCIVTVEVAEVDPIWQRCVDGPIETVLELRDEPWGQRHFMVRDPEGLLVDVVQLIPPSPEFAAAYQGGTPAPECTPGA